MSIKQDDLYFVLEINPSDENSSGGAKLYHNILKHLVTNYNVFLVLVGSFTEQEIEKCKTTFGEGMQVIAVRVNFKRLNIWDRLRGLAQMKLVRIEQKQLEMKIRETIPADAKVWLFQYSFLSLYKLQRKYNIILGLSDSIYLGAEYNNNKIRKFLKKLYLSYVEFQIRLRWRQIHVVSKEDLERFNCLHTKPFIVQNGINVDDYISISGLDRKLINKKKLNLSIAFHGTLNYHVNITSINYMCEALNDLKFAGEFNVFGRGVLESAAAFPFLVSRGEFDNLDDALRKHSIDLYFCLMKSGTGMKNKILEVLCTDIPIVSNTKAIEALPEQQKLRDFIYVIDDDERVGSANVNDLYEEAFKKVTNKHDRILYLKQHFDWAAKAEEFVKYF